jgi:DNA adenine methylase
VNKNIPKELRAIVKWPGGKISEAKKILPLLPQNGGRFIDPFVGGGAIFFASGAKKGAINDLSTELIGLYKYIQLKDRSFFAAIHRLEEIRSFLINLIDGDTAKFLAWFNGLVLGEISRDEIKTRVVEWGESNKHKLVDFTVDGIEKNIFANEVTKNLSRKLMRMETLSEENGSLLDDDVIDNFETAIHSAFYMYVRHLYNFSHELNLSPALAIATFYYIREFCYSSMFRYNKDGNFNVPYGGMAYNTKNFHSKILRIQQPIYQDYLRHTEIHNCDFDIFFKKTNPRQDDFIFLDPPYDSDFSTYDGNSFGKADHERLAHFMSKTTANFMMVIKNTDFVMNLYGNIPNTQVQIFDKKYMVSFQNRNDKQAKHLIITNYPLPVPISPNTELVTTVMRHTPLDKNSYF